MAQLKFKLVSIGNMVSLRVQLEGEDRFYNNLCTFMPDGTILRATNIDPRYGLDTDERGRLTIHE